MKRCKACTKILSEKEIQSGKCIFCQHPISNQKTKIIQK